ncbi:MAG: type II toxin-antitoxin system RelB/DinJ family antitoxin [Atopobiaceae bacterium]|nr:type II toxin-antitoxin system RelB/DinJ family antitoxin [Atopobiaceae bacterium]
MASTVVQVRMDESLRADATSVAEQLGLDLPTAIRMFLKKMVAERAIPCEGFDSVHKITVEAVGMVCGSDSFETSELQMAAGLNIVHELPCEADTTLL